MSAVFVETGVPVVWAGRPGGRFTEAMAFDAKSGLRTIQGAAAVGTSLRLGLGAVHSGPVVPEGLSTSPAAKS